LTIRIKSVKGSSYCIDRRRRVDSGRIIDRPDTLRILSFPHLFTDRNRRMRITKKEISSKNGDGFVILQPEDAEDMWHLYNLMAENDILRSKTVRNVSRELPLLP
jgi:hypothetical protein